MIEVQNLTKKYGDKVVVDSVSFVCQPGRVTGLVGPNGSGKSTTMKMILGVIQPTSGASTVLGKPYSDLAPDPLKKVGALLDNVSPVPSRRAIDHLRWIATANNISQDRVNETIELVGLGTARRKRFGTFSLGMKQRLGIGVALLGQPQVLILDEPMNGLDPDGIRWMRSLVTDLARAGSTILLSSHFMHELEEVIDDVVIINSGRLVDAGSLGKIRAGHPNLESAYFSLVGGNNE